MRLSRQQKLEQAEALQDRVCRQWRIKEAATSELVELLDNADQDVTFVASDELLQRGRASLEALIMGLSHTNGKIRAACALLMDHLADDRCVEPLYHAMRNDPLEAVRRCAMHSLVCDGCKECPLNTDVVGALIEAAHDDHSLAVKRRAVFYLGQQRTDARAIATLKALLVRETDPILLRRAERALAQQRQRTS